MWQHNVQNRGVPAVNFPINVSLEVRFHDLDGLGHVNNAVYLTYAEFGRIRYFEAIGINAGSGNVILARAEVDFIKPVQFGGTVEVQTRVSRVGNSSFTVLCEMHSAGQLASRVNGVVVWLEDGKPARLPPSVREAIARLETDPVEGL